MRAFTLHGGGPFHRVLARLHLIRDDGTIRVVWLACLAWAPLAFGLLSADPILSDPSVHVRLFVALPAMLISERLLSTACRSAIESLYVGSFADHAALDRIVERGERLRDARWPEAIILAIAIAGGQLALWNVTGPTGFFHAAPGPGGWSIARVWYAVIALPLAQFVMIRWAWRWTIWSYMLVRLWRLPLHPLATHPDFAAGLACLSRPLSGFIGYAFACGSILAAAWEAQALAGRTTPREHLNELLVFVVAATAFAVAPMLPFCGVLFRTRRRGMAQYGDFAIEYVRGFHAKWIEPPVAGSEALGSSDIQSLADLGNAYRVVATTRLFVFGVRPVLAVWVGALLPMIPLLLNAVSVEHLLGHIVKAILGGLPI